MGECLRKNYSRLERFNVLPTCPADAVEGNTRAPDWNQYSGEGLRYFKIGEPIAHKVC